MAYGSYFPAGYQQVIPQAYIPQNTYQNNSALIWVQGETAAKSYPVAPNASVVLWDSEANVIYVKSADAAGMPSIKILDYTVRQNASQKAENQPVTEFATKDDVLRLKEELDALKGKFEHRKERSDGK